MRSDLVELVGAASRHGFLVGVVTNGMLLTRRTAEALISAGLFSLDISLDSLDPVVHDGVRGVGGACRRALNAVETMISLGAGSRTSIACVLTSANIDHVEPLLRWVQGRGLRGLSLQVLEENFEGPRRIGWHEDHPLWIRDVTAVERLSDRLLALRAAGAPILNHPAQLRLLAEYYQQPERLEHVPCLVGYLNLGIGPRGDARLCHRLPTIGNVLDSPARDIWRSAAAKARREQVAACTRGCRILNCNFPPGPLTRARRLIAIRKAGHVS
jgi:MoaA/NifB/PqqE/SkfB family radical SAM enzyme